MDETATDDADRRSLRAAAAAFLPLADAASDRVSEAILRAEPRLDDPAHPDARRAVFAATRANVAEIVATLAADADADADADAPAGRPAGARVPDGALELLDHLATDGDALPVMLRAYRLGHAGFVDAWLAHLAGSTDDAATYARLARASLDHAARFVDRVCEVIAEHWAATTARAASSGRRRETLLRSLLAGRDVDARDLDHPVDVDHLVVVSRAAGTPRATPASHAAIAGLLGDAASLHTELDDATSVTWFAAPERPAARDVDRLLEAAPGDAWTVLARSGPGVAALVGATGDARHALGAVATVHPGGGAVDHADVALLATLLRDPVAARRFAASVLGPLDEDTDRAAARRTTLRAYLDCGERKAGAAAALGVHEKTVAYRVARIEDELGTTIPSRRLELHTALLVRGALGPEA